MVKILNRYYLHAVFKLNTIAPDAAVGERIRFYRLKRDMPINILADNIGVSRYALMNYQNGQTEPSLDTLYTIAYALGIPAANLFDEYYTFIDYPYQAKVLELRTNLNLSRAQFAKLLGVGKKTVERWENGHHIVSRDTWYKLTHLRI